MKVGVLALQGAFARHGAVLTRLGATAVEVRTPEALTGVDAQPILIGTPAGELRRRSKPWRTWLEAAQQG